MPASPAIASFSPHSLACPRANQASNATISGAWQVEIVSAWASCWDWEAHVLSLTTAASRCCQNIITSPSLSDGHAPHIHTGVADIGRRFVGG
ncbi:hypothetical protein ElyMa_004437400 [Elysia marginata]|uniref:Uncharacterized protein n=1 Tax=Elysia marginata TaxID=1093978 RepID=A0AAV4HED1_9GAST|nr:hypothetical protein ElyMa_004437400 [Elysia marginata]